jgi:hypothetical protein
MKRILFLFFLFGILLLTCLRIIRILFPSDKEIVGRIIEKGRKAFEKEDIQTISEIHSQDYLDAWGQDYYRLLSFLRKEFRVYDEIKVFIPSFKVNINKPFALCSLFVRVSGLERNSGEELIYASPLIISLIKENKKWYVISASE